MTISYLPFTFDLVNNASDKDGWSTKYAKIRTEAIRTQIQPSKPKREITYITNSQNTKRTYGQPSEQLFPNGWQLSNRNRTKINMNTCNVKRRRNRLQKQATEVHNKTTTFEKSVGGGAKNNQADTLCHTK